MAIRVLMVDDDPVHLELSEQFLKRQSPDYEIIPAESPEQAMNLLLEEEFDVAVCDIDLGENQPSGLDILEQVRVNENDIPVIKHSILGRTIILERVRLRLKVCTPSYPTIFSPLWRNGGQRTRSSNLNIDFGRVRQNLLKHNGLRI